MKKILCTLMGAALLLTAAQSFGQTKAEENIQKLIDFYSAAPLLALDTKTTKDDNELGLSSPDTHIEHFEIQEHKGKLSIVFYGITKNGKVIALGQHNIVLSNRQPRSPNGIRFDNEQASPTLSFVFLQNKDEYKLVVSKRGTKKDSKWANKVEISFEFDTEE